MTEKGVFGFLTRPPNLAHHVEGKMIAVDESVARWYSGCERKGEQARDLLRDGRGGRKRSVHSLSGDSGAQRDLCDRVLIKKRFYCILVRRAESP
jgi:hypothetical protein